MQTVTIPMQELATLLEVQLANGGTAQLKVTGNSMWPMLTHRRDTVTLAPPPEACKKGDLILYCRENGQYVLHRIVRVREKDQFICSGDNQWQPEPVNAAQVFAIVTNFVRAGKCYSVCDSRYQRYVAVWVALFPVRRPLLFAKNCLLRLRRKCGSLRKPK